MSRKVLHITIEESVGWVHCTIISTPTWKASGLQGISMLTSFSCRSDDPVDCAMSYRDAVEWVAYRLAAISGTELAETPPLF